MIPYSRQSINQEDIDAVIETLKSDFLTGGAKVEEFEKALAEYLGVKYVCVMNSATSALHVAYQCIDLQEDDEIITTPITFAATANAALMCKAKPVFCDVKSDGNIDETKIEELISKKAKAIVPVDFGGNPVAINKINAVAKKYQLKVIQDSSHALGSELNGKKIGGFADISIFSFHAIKPITTCGEGGALVTNDEAIYEKAKRFKSHGIVKKQAWDSDMLEIGHNYRLSDVACSMGISQLKRVDEFIDKRREIAKFYDEAFQDKTSFFSVEIPLHAKSSYHLYPILLERSLWCVKEDIYKALHNKGIGVQVHYKPIYNYTYYKNLFGQKKLQNAEEFYKAELSLPCHQEMSTQNAKYVVKILFEVLEHSKRCIR